MRSAALEKPRPRQTTLFRNDVHVENEAIGRKVRRLVAGEMPYGEFRMVPLTEDLRTDTLYQRPVAPDRVLKMVRQFRPALFQPLTLATRAGSLYVVDGQHRLACARELDFLSVPAMIHVSRDPQEEALWFVLLNQERRTVASAQKFLAQLAYGDATAVELMKLFQHYKFEVNKYMFGGSNRKDNQIQCIAMLTRAFNGGGRERVDFILYVIRNAWDGAADAQRREMIQALERFNSEHTASKKILAEAIRAKYLDPYALYLKAARVAHNNDIAIVQAISDLLAELV